MGGTASRIEYKGMNMANENRFNDGELQEIERFLRSAYITAAAKIVSARPRDPRKAVEPEIARLKQQRKPKQMRTLSDQDVRDLDEAVAGQFGSDLTKDRLLDELKRQVPNANATMEPRSFGVLFLHGLMGKLCGAKRQLSVGRFAISTTSLGALLSYLGLDPLFAPAVVWTAAKLRDIGDVAFCDALAVYLKERGI
jgi:hypothetical protein